MKRSKNLSLGNFCVPAQLVFRFCTNPYAINHIIELALRVAWQLIFIQTGRPAICVGKLKIFTPRHVDFPPKPAGPMPVLLSLVNIFLSMRAICFFGLSFPMGFSIAFIARSAALSSVPPIPMPKTTGGQASAPESLTASTI